MKLLTKGIRKSLPKLRSTGNLNATNVTVRAKFFDPCSQWTWYVTEGESVIEDGVEIDFHFYGYVVGHEKELGYFSLNELQSIKNNVGLGIERDKWFGTHNTLLDVMKSDL